MITFKIPGKPKAQERARFSKGKAYTSKRMLNWYESALFFIRHSIPEKPISGPVSVVINCYHAAPASWSKKRRIEAVALSKRPICKPDVDNISKAILDLCNKRIWKDDYQVVELWATKHYGTEDLTMVTIREL